jgi:hypothetical protein
MRTLPAAGEPEPGAIMKTPQPRSIDDEGLPRPPAVRGRLPQWLLRTLVHGEAVMFMAIAVALLVIAVVVFVQGVHELVSSSPRPASRSR